MNYSIGGGIVNKEFLDQIGKPLDVGLPGAIQAAPRAESLEVTCERYKAAYSRAVDEINYLRALVHELCRADGKEGEQQKKD